MDRNCNFRKSFPDLVFHHWSWPVSVKPVAFCLSLLYCYSDQLGINIYNNNIQQKFYWDLRLHIVLHLFSKRPTSYKPTRRMLWQWKSLPRHNKRTSVRLGTYRYKPTSNRNGTSSQSALRPKSAWTVWWNEHFNPNTPCWLFRSKNHQRSSRVYVCWENCKTKHLCHWNTRKTSVRWRCWCRRRTECLANQ